MEIINCPRCGTLFKKITKKLCPQCVEKEEEEFLKVKSYLDDNPGASVEEVAEETEVEEKTINKFIREGRLIASEFTNISAPCVSCGKPTKSGNYCKDCAQNIQGELERAMEDKDKEEEKPKQGGKIHIRDRFNNK